MPRVSPVILPTPKRLDKQLVQVKKPARDEMLVVLSLELDVQMASLLVNHRYIKPRLLQVGPIGGKVGIAKLELLDTGTAPDGEQAVEQVPQQVQARGAAQQKTKEKIARTINLRREPAHLLEIQHLPPVLIRHLRQEPFFPFLHALSHTLPSCSMRLPNIGLLRISFILSFSAHVHSHLRTSAASPVESSYNLSSRRRNVK